MPFLSHLLTAAIGESPMVTNDRSRNRRSTVSDSKMFKDAARVQNDDSHDFNS